MTNSHDALYRAICVHPDEDTPRLAFADLIEEDGDELRARFIRTQIALARLPQYDAAWVNARQFEPDAATGWGMAHTLPKPLPSGYCWHRFEFRRGFPWKVGVLSLGSFVNGGEAIFDVAPIQSLDITPRDRGGLRLLAEWLHLSRLRKLEFSIGWFGADDLARLVDSPYAVNLTELGFEFDGIAPDGLSTLAGSELFSRLTSLELRSNQIPAALLADSLAAAREPGALSRLALPHNRISRDDAAHLFALPILRELQHLDISDNPLGVEGVTAMAESGVVRGLRVLNLSKTRPGVPGVKALLESLGGLRMLDLSDNLLGPVAMKALAGCDNLHGLRVLNLTSNLVGDTGAAALAGAPALAGLLELDLRDSDIRDAGALALAESPYFDNLLRLDLRTRADRPFSKKAQSALIGRFGNRVCF